MISIYPGYEKKDSGAREELLLSLFSTDAVLVSSARAGLVLGLRALGFNRNDEIWVPAYLSHCVLSALARVITPALAPSTRTKAVLVWHHFGFVGDLAKIERLAKANGWIVIQDCAHSLFSKYEGRQVTGLGDFAVASFPKFFPSVLGGVVCSSDPRLMSKVRAQIKTSDSVVEAPILSEAFATMKQAHLNLTLQLHLRVEAVYGVLPELKTFPLEGYAGISGNQEGITASVEHREALLQIVDSYKLLPLAKKKLNGIVPFAIPIRLSPDKLACACQFVNQTYDLKAEVLHFDTACDMTQPTLVPCLVLGAHQLWTKDIVKDICRTFVDQVSRK